MSAPNIVGLLSLGICEAAMCAAGPAADEGAGPAGGAPQAMLEVRRVVYLIHPSIYEGLEKQGKLADGNFQIYREREKACQQRWRGAIDGLGPDGIFVQLYGDPSILAYAREKLGDRRVVAPSAKWENGLAAKEYHDRIAADFRRQLEEKRLTMDLETVAWELAGESFEGCVYSYGGGMASSLGLERPARINFDWTVPDARFLCHATLIETFRVGDSPVHCHVFDGPEGYGIATFLPGLRDHGPMQVLIPLADVSRVSVVNKVGNTLFARQSSTRGCIGPDRDHEGIRVVDGGLRLRVGDSWYILGRAVGRAEFLAAMRGATIDAGR